MSSIYIQEPPTLGKVLLETSVGDIDIELWSREAPKAARNFVQLCMEGYYDNTIFHRVVKGFIVQGGDPTGTGEGGESIYGEPFKDEFHSRLRFVRRGLVAMANSEKDDNGSQFFFTLAPAAELQNKHTIFGKVTGDTLFNMLKLEDTLVDRNDRPKFPPKINSAKVLNNPFEDIVPRVTKDDENSTKKQEVTSKSKATKNFMLLSFGDEAAEDEDEVNEISKEFQGKAKSSHDLANDPELSSVTLVEAEEGKKREREDDNEEEVGEKLSTEEEVERIRKKLKKDKQDFYKKTTSESTDKDKTEAIRKEYQQLKKDLIKSKKMAEMPVAVKEFKESIDKFEESKTKKNKKGAAREQETLALLARFQEKLQSVREKEDGEEKKEEKEEEEEETAEVDDERSWLSHTLNFESRETKVKDANLNDEDTYEISDPRNPITQRRREASKRQMKKR